MGFNMWFIFASLLLVSAGASLYDQGPQRFYDVNSDPETAEQNENNDIILYLTPEQVRALEADGAVVQSTEDTENDESDLSEPQVNENQDESPEQDETESAQEEEAQEEVQENSEDIQNQDINFEEILRILNEDQQEEEKETEEAAEEQTSNEPQVEEESNESPRNFSPRITVRQQLQQQQQQQEERYLAPAVAKKEQVLNSYSFTRYQPNEQRQKANVQSFQQQEEEFKEAEESPFTQEKRKYKLIPYEVEETPASQDTAEEQAENAREEDDEQRLKELIDSLVAKRFTGFNGQRGSSLQSALREMKASPKYNKQKYAYEIERFMANSQKLNAASKVKTNFKVAPTLSKQQLNKKRRLNKSKQGKGQARGAVYQKTQRLNFQKSFRANVRPFAVPVIRVEKQVQRSIPVRVETSKRINLRNVYGKTRTDKLKNKRQKPFNPRK